MQILFFLIAYVSAWSMGKQQIKNLPVQAVFPMSIAHHVKTEVLQRQKRSCFSHGKILNFRNALRKTNMKLTYQQMVQLIHNHAICVNGICIACGENYVYKIERQWIFFVQLINSLTFSLSLFQIKTVMIYVVYILYLPLGVLLGTVQLDFRYLECVRLLCWNRLCLPKFERMATRWIHSFKIK